MVVIEKESRSLITAPFIFSMSSKRLPMKFLLQLREQAKGHRQRSLDLGDQDPCHSLLHLIEKRKEAGTMVFKTSTTEALFQLGERPKDHGEYCLD